ncbi:MAG: DUF1028 domain-containing protein [Candidatus Binatia bacterium]|nr:DUF1028 domain-containing protein [Candidatus Binatia bacterium]
MLIFTTFSIVARCPRTGMVGVAVCTAVPAVGSLCPFGKSQVGAIATQAFVNPYLGIDGLRLLEDGLSATEALERLLASDPGREVRQLSIVDRHGQAAAFTGQRCLPWHGHYIGDGYAVAANMMVDETTVAAMARAFEHNRDDELPERLLKALEAGDATGGDYRGRQSAALLVYHTEAYPYCSLRVDEHRQPVAELRRIFEISRQQLFPFIAMLPTRAQPQGSTDTSTHSIGTTLRRPVDQRGTR